MRDTAFFFERNADQFSKARSNSVLARIPETIAMLRQAADLTEKFALLEEAIKVIKDYDLSSIDRFPLDDEDEIVVYAEGENGLGCSYNELNEQQQRVIVQSVNAIRKAQEIIAKAQEVRDGE